MEAFLKSILSILLCLTAILTFAQENYYLKRFTTENGLPNNKIRSIAQDKTGFLWIATWDGLSRYDGYEFKNYYHVPGDSTSLPYFSAIKVCVDKNNNVWVSTETVNGLCLYNRAKDRFNTIYFKGNDKFGLGIYDIGVDYAKNFWANCGTGLFKYNYSNLSFEKYDIKISRAEKARIRSRIIFDQEGYLWFLSKNLIKCRVDDVKKTIIAIDEYKLDSERISTFRPHFTNSFYSIYLGKDGSKWYVSDEGIFKLDTLRKEFKRFEGDLAKIPVPVPFAFVSYDSDYRFNYFYSTNKRLVIPAPDSKELTCFSFDNNNTLWFGRVDFTGVGLGLAKVVATPVFFNQPLKKETKKGKTFSVFSILKDKFGNVWTNSVGHNYLLKIEKNGNIVKCNQLSSEEFYLARNVRSMLEDSTGIWLGYNDNLFMYYDHQSEKFNKILLNRSAGFEKDTPQIFHSLLPGENGKIIISSYGIFQYDKKSKKTGKVFKSDMENRIFFMIKDHDQYWVGKNTNQLLLLNKDFKVVKCYILSKDRFNIEHLCLGDNNDVWVATLGGGIIRLNRKTGKTEIITTANGLSNNTTYSILKDKSGNLWISTDQGISRYNPQTRKFLNYGQTDGLEIEEFNSDAVFQSRDGEMFFGGMGGFVRFYPDSLNELEARDYKSNLVFTEFKVSGKTRFFSKPVYESDTVTLSKGDNNFTTTFSALNLKDPDKVKYRHQMVNYDHGWIETDFRHRSVTYSNLNPGLYSLKIEATNIPGDWVYSRMLVIVVPPFFYQTAAFKILLALLILGIVLSFITFYIRQMNLINKNIQNQLKLESLRGQMNPHFIFNSLNSINYFISQNDRLSANRYIADFAKLIRSILTNMSVEFITLNKELESLQDYLNLEHLRFGDKFNYSLNIDPDLDLENTLVFPGMIQPFIENSLWHGVRALQDRTGNITITFNGTPYGYLHSTIEDDGIGRKLASENKSNGHSKSRGIAIINERLKIYNNLHKTNLQVIIEDCYPERNETGTRVKIDIPVKEARI